jgi:hypothetical protein
MPQQVDGLGGSLPGRPGFDVWKLHFPFVGRANKYAFLRIST